MPKAIAKEKDKPVQANQAAPAAALPVVKAAATVVEMAADENSWQNKKTSTPGVEVFAYRFS